MMSMMLIFKRWLSNALQPVRNCFACISFFSLLTLVITVQATPQPLVHANDIIKNLHNEVSKLNVELSVVQSQNTSLTQEVGALQQQNQTLANTILELQQQKVGLETQLSLQKGFWQRIVSDPLLWMYLAFILSALTFLFLWRSAKREPFVSSTTSDNADQVFDDNYEESLQTALSEHPRDTQQWGKLLQFYVSTDQADAFQACVKKLPQDIKTHPELAQKIQNWQRIWQVGDTSTPKRTKTEKPQSYSDFDPENACAIKLDLARAYIEMNDRTAANELLAIVIEQGDEAQRKLAQSLLKQNL